jgi:hypothetical protein
VADQHDDEPLANGLRDRVLHSGVSDQNLRAAAFDLGGGRAADAPESIHSLAQTVGTASYRVTDGMVSQVRELVGSDMAAFEVVMSASVGAGLARWDAAIRAIDGVDDAAR